MGRSKNVAMFAMLLTFVLSGLVWAKPMNKQQAEKAVKGWLRTDARPMGESLGKEIAETEVYNGPDGTPAYYIVYLNPTGFVIVSADDLIEPIVGFVPGTGIYDPSTKNTLGTLVTHDMAARVGNARQIQANLDAGVQKKGLSKGRAAMQDEAVKAKGKWKNLQTVADNPLPTEIYTISDVRVAPLVQSEWDQSSICGGYCYNYYTPSHVYDGCVATMMAQYMRYWQYPTAGIGVHKFGKYSTRGGDGSGGPYNWSLMVLVPYANCSSLTDAERQQIGDLCSDAGVAAYMQYSSSGSGAYMHDAKNALVTTFMYSNAIRGGDETDNIGSGMYDMIDPSLDSGNPVLYGIYHTGGDGHAVVGDGYGYQGTTPYHHINMGWSSDDDAWYNLPNVDDSYYPFDVLDTVIYNIWMSGNGEIISGRVTYSSGTPFAGATVTATGTGGPYTATTNSNGIYALVKVHSATTYTVTVSASGCTFSPSSKSVTTGTSADGQLTSGSTSGNDFTTTCSPPNPPPAPASITYPTSSSTGIYTVSWPSSSGATSYELDRSADSGSTWSMIYTGANLSYSESISTGNYRYRVKATNAGGSSSWTTGTYDCVVSTAPPVPPAPPATITYPSSSSGKHTISWAVSSGATSYELDRSSDGGSTWPTQVYSGGSTTFQDNITVDGTYRYRVDATNSAGTSAWTTGTTDCVVVIPPPLAMTWEAGTPAGWDLQTLASDIARNNCVDLNDLNVIAQNWLSTGCGTGNQWCGKADMDESSQVDFLDYALLAKDWGRQAGETVSLQTIYGTAQDANGTITANTSQAISTNKGWAMAFAVGQNTKLAKAIFKAVAVNVDSTLSLQVRLFNVTGKGYLTNGHTMTTADPGSGNAAIVIGNVSCGTSVPYHTEPTGTQHYTDLVINFNSLEVTTGEYLITFDTVTTRQATSCSLIRGAGATDPVNMGKYPDGTPLPKCATVTTSSVTGNTYCYYLSTNTSTSYKGVSDLFAFQLTTPVINQPPQVDAGPSQIITEPNDTAVLEGTVTDDGLPNPPGQVTTLWTVTSGPGTVTFGDANSVETTATFSTTGTYVLRLTANDGELTAYDETIVTYQQAP